MSRSEKQTNRLAVLEAEFEEHLRVALARVASGGDSAFFFTAWSNPHRLARLSETSVELDRAAGEILKLREDLGLTAPCPATWLREAVRAHAELDEPHRLGPAQLAMQLLRRLDARDAS